MAAFLRLKKLKSSDEGRFLTAPELATRWSISPAAAYRLVGTLLPALRVGGSVRVPRDAVESYERKQLGRVPAEATP